MHDATRGNTIVDIVLLTSAQDQYRGTKKYFPYILKHFYNCLNKCIQLFQDLGCPKKRSKVLVTILKGNVGIP